MICGSCKETEGITVEHVRNCGGKPVQVEPKAPAALVPQSKYAIVIADELRFYEVKAGTRNPNVRFVNRLYGAPGDWRRVKIFDWTQRAAILELIKADVYFDGTKDITGPGAGVKRFSVEFTCCARCQAPLSDPDSRARGLGPDCKDHFTQWTLFSDVA